jgi:pimeloyl-ACP methyl ester carboxylesterase
MAEQVRYAQSGDNSIAYRVTGEGTLDVVLLKGAFTHLEQHVLEPRSVRFDQRLASFARLITFDKRGTGLSDRAVAIPTLEQRMDDVRAVMDAVGSERAALIGVSEGGPMSMLFAAPIPTAPGTRHLEEVRNRQVCFQAGRRIGAAALRGDRDRVDAPDPRRRRPGPPAAARPAGVGRRRGARSVVAPRES